MTPYDLNKSNSSSASPVEHLRQILKSSPNIYNLVEQYRTKSKENITLVWPSWCLIPSVGWDHICKELNVCNTEDVSSVITWSFSQGIYKFDRNLMSRIPSVATSGAIPTEVFFRLPEWGIYVESPLENDFSGFYAYLLYKNEIATLNVSIRGPLKEFFSVELNKSLVSEVIEQKQHTHLEIALRQLLYICSDNPNIMKINDLYPTRPRPIKTKSGWKLFPAKQPKIWLIGDKTENGDFGHWVILSNQTERTRYSCKL